MPRDPNNVHSALTRFGFEFGAATVSRIASLPKGRVVIGIETDHKLFDIYVSRAGRSVRIYQRDPKAPYDYLKELK